MARRGIKFRFRAVLGLDPPDRWGARTRGPVRRDLTGLDLQGSVRYSVVSLRRIADMRSISLLVTMGLGLGCGGVGARSIDYQREPGGEVTEGGGACSLMERFGGSSGAGGGAAFAHSRESDGNALTARYYITPADKVDDEHFVLTPQNGELVAEYEGSRDFYQSGDVARVKFQTHDGVEIEVVHWGTDDCEDLDVEAPASSL